METKMKPQATDKVIVERSENLERYLYVHTIHPELLEFIHDLPYWTVCCKFNGIRLDGSISPLYNFDEVCEFIEGLTVADIENAEDTEPTEDGLTPEFFTANLTPILVELAPVDDPESEATDVSK